MHDHTNNFYLKYKFEIISHLNKKFKDGEIILNDFKRFSIDSHVQHINSVHENTIKTLQAEIKILQEKKLKLCQENVDFHDLKEKLNLDCNGLRFKLCNKDIDLAKLTAANNTLNKYISNLTKELDNLSDIKNCPALDFFKLHLISLPFQKTIEIFKDKYLSYIYNKILN